MHPMAVDSTAVFAQRAIELGLQESIDKLTANGWKTHGLFAFAVPQGLGGVVDETVFKDRVLKKLLDFVDDEEPPLAAAVRRLYFESHTLAIGELRHRMERTDGDAPRRVPQAEREARKEAVRRRLAPGVLVEGDLDPANCVIDRFVQQVEDNVVEWVPWEEAPKRDQELASAPGKRRWMADATGAVKEKNIRHEVHADVGSALRVSWALQRRGLAAEVAGLMSFEAHELLRNRLLAALTADPMDPRFAAPSLEQVRNADKEAWRQMAKRCRAGVRPRSAADPLPMDIAVRDVLASMEFALALMPFPSSSRSKASTSREDDSAGEEARGKRRRGAGGRGQPAARQPPAQPGAQAQAPKAAKGGGRNEKRSPRLPPGLVGGTDRTKDGNPICWGFNLGQCKVVKPGERCPRGVHVCTKIGCGGKHPANECLM